MQIGLLGSGAIIPDFSEALAEAGIIPVGIYARNDIKRNEIAAQYGIRHSFRTFEDFLSSPEIDTVYVGLPNSLHFRYAEAALKRGKNVILEKPFTMSLRNAEALYALSDRKGVFLAEAISSIYGKILPEMKEALSAIGPVWEVKASFAQYSRRYDRFLQGEILPVFDKNLSGGALGDLGVYLLHAFYELFGKPLSVSYCPEMMQGVDVEGKGKAQYEGFSASFFISKRENGENGIEILGEKGKLLCHDKLNNPLSFTLYTEEGIKTFEDKETHKRLYYEVRAFEKLAKPFKDHRENTLAVVSMLEEAGASAGITYYEEINEPVK